MENALMIFVRNQEKGKVKTRLAKELGDDKTLDVYRYLLTYTKEVALGCHCSHFVFYSDFVHVADMFDDDLFTKFVQEGDDLGARMMNAFKKVFELGCKKICIIGSDCYELQSAHLEQAFEVLNDNDVVIGPAADGGYYLLGMKGLQPHLFSNKDWGTSTVYDDTIASLEQAGVAFAQLPVLNDLDTMEDLLQTDILTRIKEDV